MASVKRLCILGSTGSIGRSCLAVARSLPDRLRVETLCAGKNIEALAEQICEFSPTLACVASVECAEKLKALVKGREHRAPIKIVAGTEGQIEAVSLPSVDYVVSGSHGITGLEATFAAIEAGKAVGLANKEVLVAAGELFMAKARERRVNVIPIDSEHCALHQCLRCGQAAEVRRLILTASGGPFLRTPLEALEKVTPKMALKHPVWKMGKRISVDSATLMNKGLEMIEARWLFDMPRERIETLIHPESLAHSMVEFQDGSVIAQLSIPDMRLPIQYALTYPERVALQTPLPSLDLLARPLHFQKPDARRFPCLELARQALTAGGVSPCRLNAADEVAVEAFLDDRIKFTGIAPVIEKVLRAGSVHHLNSLEDVIACDREARREAQEAVSALAARPAWA
jgi:1-deoxy-D-xylulose-5-phosphate reductoisomerase